MYFTQLSADFANFSLIKLSTILESARPPSLTLKFDLHFHIQCGYEVWRRSVGGGGGAGLHVVQQRL